MDLGLWGQSVATLERGRALGLRATLGLDDLWLSRLDDDLSVPIVQARQHLEKLRTVPPDGVDGSRPDLVRSWEADVAAAEAVLALSLAVARQASGFTQPPSLDAPALAALAPAGGALVLFTIAPEGGVAFVLPHGQGGSVGERQTVHLPTATRQALRAQLIAWDRAYHQLQASASPQGMLRMAAIVAANAALEPMLDWLWVEVMGPVLARLEVLGVPAGAPLMLLPQGDLALLPLHAAGEGKGEQRRCVLDDHVVSYAPGGYALRTAQERLADRQIKGMIDARGCGSGLLGAFNPMQGSTRYALPLTETVEMPALADLFQQQGHPTLCCVGQDGRSPQHPPATRNGVLEAAPRYGYVHLACHGSFDLGDPAASGLQLAGDQHLSVTAVVGELRLERCRLVSLSACETAMVDVTQAPDEFVGLPAAFLQAGAPGVLAALWSVYDRPTVRLIPRFYQEHLQAGLAPAAALREAVLWLRQQTDTAVGTSQSGYDPFGERIDGEPEAADAPTPVNLYSLPIVWAAYAFHGV